MKALLIFVLSLIVVGTSFDATAAGGSCDSLFAAKSAVAGLRERLIRGFGRDPDVQWLAGELAKGEGGDIRWESQKMNVEVLMSRNEDVLGVEVFSVKTDGMALGESNKTPSLKFGKFLTSLFMSLNQIARSDSSLQTFKISSSFTYNKDLVALMQKNGFTLVPDLLGGLGGEQLFLEIPAAELR